MPAWLTGLSNVASIAGLLITIWVLWQTYVLKKSLSQRFRFPELRSGLREISKSMPELLGQWPDSKNQLLVDLSKARGVLKNLASKLQGNERNSVLKLIARLSGQRRHLFFREGLKLNDEDEVWAFYADIEEIIYSLEQKEKDAWWN